MRASANGRRGGIESRRQGAVVEVLIVVDAGTEAAPRRGAAKARNSAKAIRRKGAGSRKGDDPVETIRVSYRIAVETWQDLGIHCRLARVHEHEFVERAIRRLLKETGLGQGLRKTAFPDTESIGQTGQDA